MKDEKSQRIRSIIKLILLLICVVGVPIFIYFRYPEAIGQLKSLDQVNAILEKYQTESIFIYLGLSVLQVVIAIIPGQVLYFAAGYAYRFPLGVLLATSGCAIGTMISFWLGRLLGREAIELFFGKKKISHYSELLRTKKGYIVLFILYLIPGFPKDLIAYVAGISKIDFRPFIIISIIGRFPACAATVMMGSMLNNNSYTGIIILGALSIIICILAIIYRHKIVQYSDTIYDKLTGKKNINKSEAELKDL